MTGDEKIFTQADFEAKLNERMKNHVPKAEAEAEAEKWKRKAEAETKRADAAETRINNHLQRKELLGSVRGLIDKRQLSKPDKALATLEKMIRPGDTLEKVEKEYFPVVSEIFPPANVGGGGRDQSTPPQPNAFNQAVLNATGRGGR